MPEPVKYMKSSKDKIELKVYYKKDSSKKWHMRKKVLNTNLFNAELTSKNRDDAILALAGILKEYYDKNHVPTSEKPPEDDGGEEVSEPADAASNKGDE